MAFLVETSTPKTSSTFETNKGAIFNTDTANSSTRQQNRKQLKINNEIK